MSPSQDGINISGSISLCNPTLAEAQHVHLQEHTHTHTPSLGHISICIHINVKAAELLATPMNSHYQSIWTGLSSAGTGPKSHFTPSTSSNSVHSDVICYWKQKEKNLIIYMFQQVTSCPACCHTS